MVEFNCMFVLKCDEYFLYSNFFILFNDDDILDFI